MNWVSFLDAIYVINLNKRTDRLLQIAEDLENFEIPFERVAAIEDNNGAQGLKKTMVGIFENSLEKGHKNILVFEDDCLFVTDKNGFHNTMNKVVEQLPERYIMMFLGCQICGGATHFVSPNILAGQKMYSTHAVMYSERGMKEVLASQLEGPIDNHYVDKIEPLSSSYCTYPLLCSQRAGHSDIGHAFIDWHPFILPKYEQEINKMRAR